MLLGYYQCKVGADLYVLGISCDRNAHRAEWFCRIVVTLGRIAPRTAAATDDPKQKSCLPRTTPKYASFRMRNGFFPTERIDTIQQKSPTIHMVAACKHVAIRLNSHICLECDKHDLLLHWTVLLLGFWREHGCCNWQISYGLAETQCFARKLFGEITIMRKCPFILLCLILVS